MKVFKVYLDVCSLNRPFDDHAQYRINLEAEAVLMILDSIQKGKHELIGSEIIDIENQNNPDEWRRTHVAECMQLAKTHIGVGRREEQRAHELEHFGLKAYDAIHVACAESAGADVFLTTDDDLTKKAMQAGLVRIRIMNPVDAVREGCL